MVFPTCISYTLAPEPQVAYTIIRPGIMSRADPVAGDPPRSLALADNGRDLKVTPITHAAIAKLYDASTTLHERPKPSNSNHAEYYCIAKLLGVGGLKWFSKKRTVLMTCSRFACARCQRFLPDLCAALNIEIVVIARTSTEARFPVRIISRGGFAEL